MDVNIDIDSVLSKDGHENLQFFLSLFDSHRLPQVF